MAACLPFMLLGSSNLLALQTELSDPTFADLAAESRPSSRLSKRSSNPSIDTQPARSETPTPAPSYRRFSGFERRRANFSLDSAFPPMPELPSKSRRTRSALPNAFTLAVVHENWVGTREKRSSSEPAKPSSTKIDIENMEGDADECKSVRPRGSYSLFPSPRSSVNSVVSSRLYTSSTLISTPLQPSPALRTDSRSSSTTSLQTLAEDQELATPPRAERLYSHSRSRSVTYPQPRSHTRTSSIYSLPDTLDFSRPHSATFPNSTSPRHASSSKKVSFSKTADEVIKAPEDITEERHIPRRQSSWNNFLLISTPPIAARPVPTRRISIPSARGQAAGRSILRPTNSFTSKGTEEQSEGVNMETKPVPTRKLIGRTASSRNKSSPPPSHGLAALPENTDGDEEFEDVDLTSGLMPMVSCTSSISSSSSWSSPSDFASSNTSVSSTSLGNNKGQTPPPPYTESTNTKAVTLARYDGSSIRTISVPSHHHSSSISSTASSTSDLTRHWSMQGVERWVRRSGVGLGIRDERSGEGIPDMRLGGGHGVNLGRMVSV